MKNIGAALSIFLLSLSSNEQCENDTTPYQLVDDDHHHDGDRGHDNDSGHHGHQKKEQK